MIDRLRNRWFLGVVAPTMALGIIRRAVGLRGLGAFLVNYARCLVRPDPLRPILAKHPESAALRFTTAQLRPVLLLEDTLLAMELERERIDALVGEVVSSTGARFIEMTVRMPTADTWARTPSSRRDQFVREMILRFGNAEGKPHSTDEGAARFEITACLFASLTRELGRPHLAPHFCDADRVFYERREDGLTLERPQTLATGGSCCDFRISFRDQSHRDEHSDQ